MSGDAGLAFVVEEPQAGPEGTHGGFCLTKLFDGFLPVELADHSVLRADLVAKQLQRARLLSPPIQKRVNDRPGTKAQRRRPQPGWLPSPQHRLD